MSPPTKFIQEFSISTHPAFLAPIDSVLAWSDDTPRPPERHAKKLSAWRSRNSSGRLVTRQGEYRRGSMIMPASFRLHEGDHGAGGVIAIRIYRSFSLDSSLSFSIIEVPAIGSCRVFDRAGENAELVHLAASRQRVAHPAMAIPLPCWRTSPPTRSPATQGRGGP